jgi:c-di-GMP-binding flagellar brake protein YcgR
MPKQIQAKNKGMLMAKEVGEFKDRRKFVRVSIYAITRYFCPLRDMEVGVQTRVYDISEGGALLMSFSEGLPTEAVVKMSFVMPGPESQLVTVEGRVRHTGFLEKDLYRSGVEFIKLKKKARKAIHEYVALRRKK